MRAARVVRAAAVRIGLDELLGARQLVHPEVTGPADADRLAMAVGPGEETDRDDRHVSVTSSVADRLRDQPGRCRGGLDADEPVERLLRLLLVLLADERIGQELV